MTDKNIDKNKTTGLWIPQEILDDNNLSLQEKVLLAKIEALDNEEGCFATNDHFSKLLGVNKVRVSNIISSLIEKKYIVSTLNPKLGNRRVLSKTLRPIIEKANTLLSETIIPSYHFGQYPIIEKAKHNKEYNKELNKEREEVATLPQTPATSEKIGIGEAEKKSSPLEEKNKEEKERFTPHFENKSKEKKTKEVFQKPSIEQISTCMISYAKVFTIPIGADSLKMLALKFHTHYEGNGWKVGGKRKMKNSDDWETTCKKWVVSEGEKGYSYKTNSTNYTNTTTPKFVPKRPPVATLDSIPA